MSGDEEVVTLPDFRNLGVILRSVVLAEVVNLMGQLAYSPGKLSAITSIKYSGPFFEISMLSVIGSLLLLGPRLMAVPYRIGVVLVLGVSAVVASGVEYGLRLWIGDPAKSDLLRAVFVAILLSGLILFYFNWRQRALSPALVEARLIALQARIRPHFLFNGLNTAISMVRANPALAERVLHDMSDLFRAALVENRLLVSVADEIALTRAYLDIEQIRLGDRLKVIWEVDEYVLHARMPPLVLQPLLENAVHHGIEPSPDGGEVIIKVANRARGLQIEVVNTFRTIGSAGNQIALKNINERLALHFDSEATMETLHKAGRFSVIISIPLRCSE